MYFKSSILMNSIKRIFVFLMAFSLCLTLLPVTKVSAGSSQEGYDVEIYHGYGNPVTTSYSLSALNATDGDYKMTAKTDAGGYLNGPGSGAANRFDQPNQGNITSVDFYYKGDEDLTYQSVTLYSVKSGTTDCIKSIVYLDANGTLCKTADGNVTTPADAATVLVTFKASSAGNTKSMASRWSNVTGDIKVVFHFKNELSITLNGVEDASISEDFDTYFTTKDTTNNTVQSVIVGSYTNADGIVQDFDLLEGNLGAVNVSVGNNGASLNQNSGKYYLSSGYEFVDTHASSDILAIDLDNGQITYYKIPDSIDISFAYESAVYHDVTFMVGEQEYDSQSVQHGYSVSAPANPEIPEGFDVFDGWYLENATTPYNFASTINDDVTLYARFASNHTFTIQNATSVTSSGWATATGGVGFSKSGEVYTATTLGNYVNENESASGIGFQIRFDYLLERIEGATITYNGNVAELSKNDLLGTKILYMDDEGNITTSMSDPTNKTYILKFAHDSGEDHSFLRVYNVLGDLDITLTNSEVIPVASPYGANDGMEFTRFDYYQMEDICEVPLTYEAWIKVPSTYRDRANILGNWVGYGYGVQFGLGENNGVPRIVFARKALNSNDTSKTVSFSDIDVRTNTWTHVAIAYDASSGTFKCYINGNLAQTVSSSYASILTSEFTNPITIGTANSRNDGNPYAFKGKIAYVSLYRDTRTAEEIYADASTGADLTDENLIAAYDLSDGIMSETITDLAGNHDLKIENDLKDSVELPSSYEYTMVALPDLQFLNYFWKDLYHVPFDDIINNAEARNTVYVMGLGDSTQSKHGYGTASTSTTITEATLAGNQFHRFNNVLDYTVVRGNHDEYDDYETYIGTEEYVALMDGSFNGSRRTPGEKEGSMDAYGANVYKKFEVNGTKYLGITLDYGPSDEVLEWACGVVEANPDYRVIVTTHGYMWRDNTTIDPNDSVVPTASGYPNNGDDIWDKFVSKYENIVMALSGHIDSEGVQISKAQGENGNYVTQILINGEGLEHYGYGEEGEAYGMEAIFYFLDDDEVAVAYYSPIKDKYLHETQVFTLNDASPATKYTSTCEHDYPNSWQFNEETHYHECSLCGNKIDIANHSGGSATCIAKAVCEVCGASYGELASHQLTLHPAVAPTETENGNIAYYTCDVCNKYFADSNANQEIAYENTIVEPGQAKDYRLEIIYSYGKTPGGSRLPGLFDSMTNTGYSLVGVRNEAYYDGPTSGGDNRYGQSTVANIPSIDMYYQGEKFNFATYSGVKADIYVDNNDGYYDHEVENSLHVAHVATSSGILYIRYYNLLGDTKLVLHFNNENVLAFKNMTSVETDDYYALFDPEDNRFESYFNGAYASEDGITYEINAPQAVGIAVTIGNNTYDLYRSDNRVYLNSQYEVVSVHSDDDILALENNEITIYNIAQDIVIDTIESMISNKTARGTLEANGNVGLTIRAEVDESVDKENAYVLINNKKTYLSETVDNEGKLSVTLPSLRPKELADNISIRFYDENNNPISNEINLSVKDYIYSLMNATDDQPTKDFYKSLLNYGSYVQKYFGHNKDDLANSELNEEDKDVSALTHEEVSGYAPSILGETEGISAYGQTLTLKNEVSYKIYFVLDGSHTINEYSFLENDNSLKAKKEANNIYSVEIEKLAAPDLDETHVVEVRLNDGGSLSVSCSVLSYVELVLKDTPVTDEDYQLVDVAKSLFYYNQKANVLLGN